MDRSGLTFEVVVFNYNYARYLRDCLDGIASQNRRPDVVRVSDDCSTENTPGELKAIVARHPWASLQTTAYNMGALDHYRSRTAEVTADAYMVHSADDFLIDPTFFSAALNILEANANVIMVYGHVQPVDSQKRPLPHGESGWEIHQSTMSGRNRARGWTLHEGAQIRKALAFHNVIPAICCVIRTAVHDRIPPFPIANPHCHDWQQWYLMSYHGDYACVERPVIAYRVHQSSLSEGFEKRNEAYLLLSQAYDELLGRPELTPDDRLLLELGKMRKYLQDAPVGQLPSAVLGNLHLPGAVQVTREALLRRLARRLRHLSEQERDALYRAALAPRREPTE